MCSFKLTALKKGTGRSVCLCHKINTRVFKACVKKQRIKFFLIKKANEMHYFSNLFDKVLYMFRTCPLSIMSILTLYEYTRNRSSVGCLPADSQQN
jgi:hypothetical protein